MNKIKTCTVNSKVIPLQASKSLFTKIALVAQIISLNLRQVFKFPLRPMPWSLAEPQARRNSGTNCEHKWKICFDCKWDGFRSTSTSI